ncbi:MAG: pyruvate formate lyase family protein, partial [Clostridia bacterium]|nr:pyruvate formate lyase family protein [Clostridia bacterium]
MAAKYENAVKQHGNLSPRTKWLRDYYFEGVNRKWNNEYTGYTTGTPWDTQFDEMTYYIVPENHTFLSTFTQAFKQLSQVVPMPDGFWDKSLVERKADFLKEVVVNQVPMEIIPKDLLCGCRFNIMTSMCLTKAQQKERNKLVKEARKSMTFLFKHGYGNSGATSGHLIPDYKKIIDHGFKGEYEYLEGLYNKLPDADKNGSKGAQLRAMMTCCTMPKELALKFSNYCRQCADKVEDPVRKDELLKMAENTAHVPWEPARNFWEAVQSLWMTHMLVMSDENYPGPGVSFGRIDQYLYPYYQKSVEEGMSEDFMKDILGCFWFHCNTAYDGFIKVGGNQGITAGFGQLLTLSGMGKGGQDMTNDLTYLILDVIDDWSPILEPKPNVRLHAGSPEKLLDKVVDMVSRSQGAPFLLNF